MEAVSIIVLAFFSRSLICLSSWKSPSDVIFEAKMHQIRLRLRLCPNLAGELTALPSPLAVRRGEGLPPLFKLLGFRLLSLPPHFVASPYTKLSSVVYRTITWLQMILVLIRPPVSFESTNGSCNHYCVSIFQQKFDKFILMKITTRCHILKLKFTQSYFGWGSAPDPARELTALPRPPSWFKGAYF